MNLAAILVSCLPQHLEEVQAEVNRQIWAEVHHVDEQGKMIVVAEGKDAEQDLENIRVLKGLKYVVSAEMIQYFFEDEMEQMWDQVHNHPVTLPQELADDDYERPIRNHYQTLKKAENF